MAGFREETVRRPLMMGNSRAMRELCALIEKIAPSDINVLITGETGTGKELVARAIHDLSPRNRGPLIAVNCAALPENLVESELFGHEKGAFTGAGDIKIGAFELAHNSTIFLDEIGDMPLPAQAKMLRVLEERELKRVGGTRIIKLDVRVIAATNKDLDRAVREGSFREDLLYRLNVINLATPSLRERMEDVPYLVDLFLAHFSESGSRIRRRISSQALDVLMRYSFPGNVRELRNIIGYACTMAEPGFLDIEHLPSKLLNSRAIVSPYHERCLEEDRLLESLHSITIFWKQGVPKSWYSAMRSVPLERIHQFLMAKGRKAFSRAQFADYLREHGQGPANKYATAGRYLKKLVENKVLVHNGKKTNQVRFRLSDQFLTELPEPDASVVACLHCARHDRVYGTAERYMEKGRT